MPDTVDGRGTRRSSSTAWACAQVRSSRSTSRGLYAREHDLERPEQIIAADTSASRVDMHMLRDLEKDKIVEAINEGFEKNSNDKMPALKDRLDKFAAADPGPERGPGALVHVRAGQGHEVKGAGKEPSDRRGQGLRRRAVLRAWSGQRTRSTTDLKKGMLGGEVTELGCVDPLRTRCAGRHLCRVSCVARRRAAAAPCTRERSCPAA